MKKLIFTAILLSLSFSSFAVSYCTIKGTDQSAGYFPGDDVRGPSIYIEGRGYYGITSIEDEGQVLVSSKGSRRVVLDFARKTLMIDNQVMKLVKCVRTGSE